MLSFIEDRIVTAEEAARRRAAWRLRGERCVFTNGCFDLIHPGHLHYLAEARALGQYLIVGLNSDASVQRLKGPQRPVMDERARALLLASLCFVDLVVLFSEDTPLQLIQQLQPDVLVKGGDYRIDQIVGAPEVQAAGGEVKVLSFLPGYSSSQIIDRILREE